MGAVNEEAGDEIKTNWTGSGDVDAGGENPISEKYQGDKYEYGLYLRT